MGQGPTHLGCSDLTSCSICSNNVSGLGPALCAAPVRPWGWAMGWAPFSLPLASLVSLSLRARSFFKGCCNKVPLTGDFKTTEIILSQFWRPGI